MGDVAKYSTERIEAKILNAENYVGVDNLLPERRGKEASSYVPTEGRCIVFKSGDTLVGNIRPYLKKIWIADCAGGTNGDVLVIQANIDFVLPKFLYYVLSSDKFFAFDMQHSKGAKMPRGNKYEILKYEFSLPPIKDQQHIIEILDRFEKLCNDISEGLPAEIEARQKQYEYYRDKLLKF
ncbi:MAG: restriction endonuclease subunit S [Clostridia bacterium]|nr:restriction endonuclease subunit S [Clostridia bacterium]